MHDGGPGQAAPSGFVGWYTRIMMSIGASAMAAILIIMMVQVVARYVFNASLIWAEEICRYILVWITFLFIGLAFQRGELVTVDILTIKLSAKAQFILKSIVSIPVLAFLVLMVINSYDFFGRFHMQTIPAVDFIWESITGHAAGVSILWVYHSVTIGCTLLVVHILVSLVAEARALVRMRDEPPSTQITG
ncbi:TRAP transporter small permease [Microbaculum marinum]|uniref:TRAP transporter small permease protein n=1 Tax=Microbaculum marinum TaxID=1764581 RepID=A0AAW9RQN2_9HYPH